MRRDFGDDSKPTQWQPGQSGNPGGRPKGVMSQILSDLGDQEKLVFSIQKVKDGVITESTASLITQGQTIKQATMAKLWQMALNGDIKAMQLIFNRLEGRVPQPLVVADDAGNPIQVVLMVPENDRIQPIIDIEVEPDEQLPNE